MPAPALVSAVADEMGDILGTPVDDDDDFFVCGGDSLRAVELIDRLVQQRADSDPSMVSAMLDAVFEDPTPRGLASVLERHVKS